MTELEQYIQSYFGLIQQDELDKLSSLFQPESLKKGDYFVKAGKPCNKLSFIRSGLLRIFGTTEDKEITQWISSKGFFVTDLSGLVFENPARRTIQALTDTELFTIHRDDYQNIGKVIPQWSELEKRFLAKCFIMMEDRIFSHLSLTAEERYNLFFEHNKELFNQVPLQYLASMLGMTPETFSRIRKKQVS